MKNGTVDFMLFEITGLFYPDENNYTIHILRQMFTTKLKIPISALPELRVHYIKCEQYLPDTNHKCLKQNSVSLN